MIRPEEQDDERDIDPIGGMGVEEQDPNNIDEGFIPRSNQMRYPQDDEQAQQNQDQQDQPGGQPAGGFRNGGFAKGMSAVGNIANGVLNGMQGRPQQPLQARYGQQPMNRVPGMKPPRGPIGAVPNMPTTPQSAPNVGPPPPASPLTSPTDDPNAPQDGPSPAFALGGIVNHPTRAILGENGPEAVVPLHPGMGGGNGARMRPSSIPSMGRSKLKMPALPLGKRSAIGG